MKKINTSDLLIFILILVFVFDVDVKHMNALDFIAAAVSIVWIILFISKMFSSKEGG